MQARNMILAGALLLVMVMVSSASAAVIQIQLGGVGLQYDGTKIVDYGVANPDTLTNATFFVNETLLGVDADKVTLDLNIPGVPNMLVGGDTVYSLPDGTLALALGDGEFLSLKLKSVAVTYIPVLGTVRFIFAGSSSTIDGQNLPYNLSLGEPVSVSFSTQISQVTAVGGYVTGFISAGTGEIQGVPEPATMGLLAIGGLALVVRRRRK